MRIKVELEAQSNSRFPRSPNHVVQSAIYKLLGEYGARLHNGELPEGRKAGARQFKYWTFSSLGLSSRPRPEGKHLIVEQDGPD